MIRKTTPNPSFKGGGQKPLNPSFKRGGQKTLNLSFKGTGQKAPNLSFKGTGHKVPLLSKEGLGVVLRSVILFFLLIFASCSPDKCLNSTGNIISQNKQLPYFNKIIINDNISLILENGTNIRVEAGENLIENISFEVKQDSTLILKNTNVCEWLRSYASVKVYVGIDNIKSISSDSFGNISTEKMVNINALQLDIFRVSGDIDLELSGNYFSLFTSLGAKINLKGNIANLGIYTLGFGKIDASQMKAQNATVKHGGNNDVFVNATQSLKATLESNGNLYYKQEPITKDIQYFDEGKAFLKP